MPEQNEPDPRFTLANERTYLAWIRTSLALIAGGVALAQLGPDLRPEPVWRALSIAPVLTGATLSVLAHRHWRECQRALREDAPLPGPKFASVLTGLVVAAGATLAILLLVLS